MQDVTATEAARNFADLLDGVEHRGVQYTIVRRGRAVAHLEPVSRGRGADVKALLRRQRPHAAWSKELSDLRGLLKPKREREPAVREQSRRGGAHDVLIAATARATDRTIVTADRQAFTNRPGVVSVTHR